MSQRLQDARTLIDGKNLLSAIQKCEEVIAAFVAHYGKSKSKVYCASSPAETLGYLTKAAAEMNEGKFDANKKNAIALSSVWSDAYFLRAYALQDLGRTHEARSTLQSALALSPWNSRYLSELGSVYVAEKNWNKAKDVFELAEEYAPISPDNSIAENLGRARRGLGYVFVELGQLPKAEKKYQLCLKADPNDKRAARELEYVRGLIAKTKGSQPKSSPAARRK